MLVLLYRSEDGFLGLYQVDNIGHVHGGKTYYLRGRGRWVGRAVHSAGAEGAAAPARKTDFLLLFFLTQCLSSLSYLL